MRRTFEQQLQLFDIVHLMMSTFLVLRVAVASRTWAEMFMDQAEDCERIRRPTHDLSEGDVYLVKSDDHGGHAREQRMPAECSVGFNLGDRALAVAVLEWSCDQPYPEPFLAVYADCDKQRRHQLAFFNCTTPKPESDIVSTSSCVTLYHYRGHRKGGYYFSLNVVVGRELFSFPAGGIAAVVVAIVVIVMVVAKVICVVTGYERRLPNVDLDAANLDDDENDDDDQRKQIFADRYSTSEVASSMSFGAVDPSGDVTSCTFRAGTANSFSTSGGHVAPEVVDDGDAHAVDRLTPLPLPQHQQQPWHHVTRPNGNTRTAAVAAAAAELAACGLDLDFLDLPADGGADPYSTRQTKRYPSARASNIWRHK
jgi:hypothetical protein